jgi:hypothetical protein
LRNEKAVEKDYPGPAEPVITRSVGYWTRWSTGRALMVRGLIVAILLIVGAVAIAVGVLYITQPSHSLPSFFPGYAAHVTGKRPHRGYAGIAVGAVLIVVALLVASTGRRRRSPRF